MNLRNLTDDVLLEKTDQLVGRERELLSEILHHLREIERRRLFSALGFRSLFEYATKKLGYADDQAMRRISAVRLLCELPEIESKIQDDSLTLTNIGMAQTLFRQEKKAQTDFTKNEKMDLLIQLQNKSKREAEKIVLSRSSVPEKLRPDRIRQVTESFVEIKFMANTETRTKIEKIRGLLAHSHPNIDMSEIIDHLCDIAIQNLDPTKKTGRQTAKLSPAPALKRRITSHHRRVVWRRAGSRSQICGSVHALQVDHIRPKFLGGTNAVDNLRLLCRSCNQRAAIEVLGANKMYRFLDGNAT